MLEEILIITTTAAAGQLLLNQQPHHVHLDSLLVLLNIVTYLLVMMKLLLVQALRLLAEAGPQEDEEELLKTDLGKLQSIFLLHTLITWIPTMSMKYLLNPRHLLVRMGSSGLMIYKRRDFSMMETFVHF